MSDRANHTISSPLPGESTVYLFCKREDTIKKIPVTDAMFEIYLKCRIPTESELKANNIKTSVKDIKKIISSIDSYIPLYDVFTFNIYIIQKRNVYIRVMDHDYRFPDELIMENIKKARLAKIKKLKNNQELEKDEVFIRSIRKADLMIDFMNQFDINILYNTYLDTFYRYASEISNATYTCIRKSFMPHKSHLKPYYTRDEVIKLGMNIGLVSIPVNMSYVDYKDLLSKKDYHELCLQIQTNDVTTDTLMKHQNYIIDNGMVGLIQYYTVQGSFFMNQYMRGMTRYEYRNDYLEDNIKKIWKLVLAAPAFDNDYILYRFVNTDQHLRHLAIGDVYIERGFTSTTRDPFYRNDLYKFGFVLIKIRIQKNVIGVGLCLETLSHFPFEEEIILPPMSHIKLISKNEQCKYYHPDEQYAADIKTRYEFEWIKNGELIFSKRPEYTDQTEVVDFIYVDKIKSVSIKEKIDLIVKTHFDPMNRIKCKIGDNTFYVVGEWYDSTGPYADMYALKTADGFSLYSLYEGYILFMIEIGDVNGRGKIIVNYFTKYSHLNRQEIMGDDNFIKFIASIGNYFDVPNVVIYADFMSCDKINLNNGNDGNDRNHGIDAVNRVLEEQDSYIQDKQNCIPMEQNSNTGLLPGNNEITGHDMSLMKNNGFRKKKQRTFEQTKNKTSSELEIGMGSDMASDISSEINVTDMETDVVYTGGSYCVDYYRYLKHGIKRYDNTTTLNVELQPNFSYHDLDMLRTLKPSIILKKEDRDEVYQIYMKNYKSMVTNEKNNVADFYVWMIENKCYLMDILNKKMEKMYRSDNPFKKKQRYILDSMSYLYNRRYVSTYNRYIKMDYDEEQQILTLPKNEYRIKR
jgi:hypothetical protein